MYLGGEIHPFLFIFCNWAIRYNVEKVGLAPFFLRQKGGASLAFYEKPCRAWAKRSQKRVRCMRQKCGLAPFFFHNKSRAGTEQKQKQKIVVDSKAAACALPFMPYQWLVWAWPECRIKKSEFVPFWSLCHILILLATNSCWPPINTSNHHQQLPPEAVQKTASTNNNLQTTCRIKPCKRF